MTLEEWVQSQPNNEYGRKIISVPAKSFALVGPDGEYIKGLAGATFTMFLKDEEFEIVLTDD